MLIGHPYQQVKVDSWFYVCVLELELGKLQSIFENRSQGFFIKHKALPGFFLCIFSSLTCLKKHVTCFQQAGSSTEEGTSQPVTISKK
jgi:hypothetical protein